MRQHSRDGNDRERLRARRKRGSAAAEVSPGFLEKLGRNRPPKMARDFFPESIIYLALARLPRSRGLHNRERLKSRKGEGEREKDGDFVSFIARRIGALCRRGQGVGVVCVNGRSTNGKF